MPIGTKGTYRHGWLGGTLTSNLNCDGSFVKKVSFFWTYLPKSKAGSSGQELLVLESSKAQVLREFPHQGHRKKTGLYFAVSGEDHQDGRLPAL